MNGKVIAAISILLLAALACSSVPVASNTVLGSGKIISETRNVRGFTGVRLAGSGDVDVKLGPAESVIVEADDNIMPLIETSVSGGKLIIRTKPFTSIRTTKDIHVTIVAKSLDELTLGGSGTIHATGMSGPNLIVALPGSGDITVTGTTGHATITLLGSGNIYCDGLKAHSVGVQIMGSGNVTTYADQSLDASIFGSGNIQYSGQPAQVTKDIKGSGTITP